MATVSNLPLHATITFANTFRRGSCQLSVLSKSRFSLSMTCLCCRSTGRALVTFFACALSLPALASDFTRHAIRCDHRDMEYLAYVPAEAANQPLPVLLLLHGAGDQAEHFAQAWKSLARKKQIVLIAPQLPRDPTLEPHIPKILPCLVDDVRKQANLDSRRIYLFGYSMGGYLAYDGALFDSDYFAAAVIHALGIADEDADAVGQI